MPFPLRKLWKVKTQFCNPFQRMFADTQSSRHFLNGIAAALQSTKAIFIVGKMSIFWSTAFWQKIAPCWDTRDVGCWVLYCVSLRIGGGCRARSASVPTSCVPRVPAAVWHVAHSGKSWSCFGGDVVLGDFLPNLASFFLLAAEASRKQGRTCKLQPGHSQKQNDCFSF